MKRILTMILVVLFIFSLTGCTPTEEQIQQKATQEFIKQNNINNAKYNDELEKIQEQRNKDLDAIQRSSELRQQTQTIIDAINRSDD